MTIDRKPKQNALFPSLPREQPMLSQDGKINDYWALFFDQLINCLQNNLSPEGILVPAQTTADIAKLTAVPTFPPDGANTRTSNQNILYDSTTNEFKGNINGVWKTFTLT